MSNSHALHDLNWGERNNCNDRIIDIKNSLACESNIYTTELRYAHI